MALRNMSAGKRWISPQAKLESALRALPIVTPDEFNAIPYSTVIPAIAHQILVMRRPNDLKKLRKGAVTELTTLISVASRLSKLLEKQTEQDRVPPLMPRLSPMALLPLPDVVAVLKLSSLLQELIPSLTSVRAQNYGKGRRGRVAKADEDAIGLYLYQEFYRLTGHKPKRTVRGGKTSSLFQTLISDVFKALAIKSSPEATAARVMEKMKTKKGI